MTGGFVFVFDELDLAASRVNPELVELVSLEGRPVLQEHLRGLISTHYLETGSPRAERILNGFDEHYFALFKLIKPKTTSLASLLGRRGNSPEETLEVVQ